MGSGRGVRIPIHFTTPNLGDIAQRMQALVRAQDGLSRIAGITARYVGFNAVIHKVAQSVKNALNNIKEIDKTITNIAVVTNMSQEELWGKMGQYMNMAKQYGTAVNNVYTVSQLFYQQGLQTAQVMSMTNETLKMAKIAGMDYAEAADAMTVAVRAFNIEMSEAQRVTDTYSALAANFAVSSQEIANAMEKTASSAASVGMSIESTSAFMSVMIQTTRESAENIGSAMKSIISRYGEMKASPSELLNVDGEEVSFNKVDKALKSIGISIKDARGQFRDFDDVVMELAEKWHTLDNNTQRYIATIMAGNRQQSRFIALVSNTDELNRAMTTATDSQDASLQQVLKTMNSIETKAQQMKSAFTDIYANWGLEETLKNFYDMVTKMLKNIKNQGLETIAAIAVQLTSLSSQFRGLSTTLGYAATGRATYRLRRTDGTLGPTRLFSGSRQQYTQLTRTPGFVPDSGYQANRAAQVAAGLSTTGMVLNMVGATITASALTIEDESGAATERSKVKSGVGQALSGGGVLLSDIANGAAQGGLIGGIFGAVTGLVKATPIFISAIKNVNDGLDYTAAERYANAIRETKKAQDDYTTARAKTSSLESQIEKIKDLEKSAYSSAESLANYQTAMNNLADTYPTLVSAYDGQGNAIIDLTKAEEKLLNLRRQEAQAANNLSNTELTKEKYRIQQLQEIVNGGTGKAWADYAFMTSSVNGYRVVSSTNEAGELVDILGATTSNLQELVKAEILLRDAQGNFSYAAGKTYADAYGHIYNNLEPSSYFGLSNDARMSFNHGDDSLKDFITQWDKEYAELINEGIISKFSDWLRTSDLQLDVNDDDLEISKMLEAFNLYREDVKQRLEAENESLAQYYDSISDSLAKQTLVEWESSQYQGDKNNFARQELIGASTLISGLVDEYLNSQNTYANLGTWYELDKKGFAQAANEAAQKYAQYLYDLALSDDELSNLLGDAGDLTKYRNIDELAESYDELANTGNEFWQALAAQLIEQNKNARSLLYRQIYGRDVSYTNGQFSDNDSGYNTGLNNLMTASETFQSLAKATETWFNGDDGEIKIISNYAGLLANTITKANELYNSGYTIRADRELAQLQNLYTDIASLPSDLQNSLYQVIATIDWSSRESIETAIEEINNYSEADLQAIKDAEIIEELREAANNVVFNVISAYDNYMNQLAETSKNVTARYTSANGGMTLDAAMAEYNKFMATAQGDDRNLTFNALYQYDEALNKFVYTQQGLHTWILKDEQAMLTAESNAAKAKTQFEDMATALQNNNYAVDNATITDVYGDLAEQIQELYSNYLTAEGNGTFIGNFEAYVEQQIANAEIAVKQADAVYNAYIQNQAQLIKNIDWKALASGKITAADKAQLQQLLGGTLTDIDAWWSKFVLLSAEQKAIEYQRILASKNIATDSPAAKAAIAEIGKSSFEALSSTITELLKGEGTALSETAINLINAAGLDYLVNNAGQEVLTEAQTSVDAALELLEALRSSLSLSQYLDQKRSIFESENNIAQKGIKGTMTAADLQALGYGLNIGDVINTGAGYKWGIGGAARAYSSMKANSPLQASAFAAVLAAEKEYGNYAQILAKVRDLTNQLNNAAVTGNTDLIATLQEELGLYKEIAASIYEQGKAFNFMSNALPTGIQNISDYFENVASALIKFNDAVESNNGEMAYKDFYNMMDHMRSNLENSNLADAEQKLQQVNELMILAAKTAHNVDGTWSVNISNLCQDIDLGTSELGETFTDSIHEMAKQQIEWIDSQIALLEGISVLENLDLQNGDSAFDQIKNYLTSDTDLNKTADEAIETLRKLAEKFKSMGLTIQDAESWFFGDSFIGDEGQLRTYIDGIFTQLQTTYGTSASKFFAWLGDENNWLEATNGEAWNITTLWKKFSTGLIDNPGAPATENEIEPTPVDVQLMLHSDGAKATLTIGDSTFEWDESQGTLAEFVTQSINEFVAENPDTQLPETLAIEINGINVISNDAEVTPTLSYKQGNVTLTGFGAENSNDVKSKIVEWASAQGIKAEEITDVKPADIITGGVGEVSVKIGYDVTSKTYKFGDIECASKEELLNYINNTLMSAGVTLEDIADGTNLTIENGKITLTSVTAIANSDSKIECVVTLDATSVDNAATIAANKTKVTNWQNAVKSAKDTLSTIEITDITGLDGTVETYDATKDVMLTAGLVVEIKDNGIQLVGSDVSESFATVDELLAYFSNKYSINGSLSLNSNGVTSSIGPTAATGTKAVQTVEAAQNEEIADNIENTTNAVDEIKATAAELLVSINEEKVALQKQLDEKRNQFIPAERLNTLQAAGNSSEYENAKAQNTQLKTEIDNLQSQLDVLNTIEALIGKLESVGNTSTEVSYYMMLLYKSLQVYADKIKNVGSGVSASGLSTALDNLIKTINDKAQELINPEAPTTSINGASRGKAKGNVALAKGTLMGELGPELVVANGRYFVAGQNGAEFVDLPEDAIVFNHLQTASLLANGHGGRGKAVNGDAAALAYAKGTGPAKAGASDAIAQLKQLRAMWENLLGSSASDLAKKKGSGGGSDEVKAVLDDLNYWYNLLRQIERAEQQITLEQKKRENMKSGSDYIKSLRIELSLLQEQEAEYRKLAEGQQALYDAKRKALDDSAYSMFFTYDADGLMQYRDANFNILEELYATDVNGKAKYNADQQVQLLKNNGFNVSVLQYNSEGEKSKDSEAMMNVFKDEFDGWQKEIDGIWDTLSDYRQKELDALNKQNKILEEFREIQIGTENLILQAVEDKAQSAIDEMQKQADTLGRAAQDYTNGLRDALSKEKQLYDRNQSSQELNQLQRQLAILQRSGGSASAIKSLQDQIDSQLKDQYFLARETEINAIEEASNNQIEKLQEQIDIMSESLEYQKENGLLWNNVNDVLMTWDEHMIIDFLREYSNAYKSLSATAFEKQTSDDLKLIEQYLELMNPERNNFADWWNGANLKDEVSKVNNGSLQWERYGGDAAVRAQAQTAYLQAINNGKTKEEAEKLAREKVYKELQLDEEKGMTPSSINNSTTGGSSGGSGDSDATAIRTKYYDALQKAAEAKKKESLDEYVQRITGTTLSELDATAQADMKTQYAAYEKTKNDEYAYYKKVLADLESKYPDYISEYYINKRKEMLGYSEGGDVNYTGLAMVHGSKAHPEAFISADDREMMKSSIFSTNAHAVVSAMEQFLAFANKLSTNLLNGATNTNGMNIENVNINLDSGIIANDYDARRAAQTVMDEIVKVARQSTNLSLSRR